MTDHTHDHITMLHHLGALANLLSDANDIKGFLNKTTQLVAEHLKADVCSIYLFEETSQELVLRATIGLNPRAVDRIRMKPGEGLVGTTFSRMTATREPSARCNPDFKYFKEAEEDHFDSFLAVPIFRGVQKIGVLVVQHEQGDYFTERDEMALKALASQLAGTIENARLLMDLYEATGRGTPTVREVPRFIKGKAASPGFAFAPAAVHLKSHVALLESRSSGCVLYTVDDLREAVESTVRQLMTLQNRLAERLPESASLIFTAHFMMLKDPKFVPIMDSLVENHVPVPDAVRQVARRYIDIFAASPHAYIREKVNDIEDLAGRILRNLERGEKEEAIDDRAERVVVAATLYPSEILKLASEDVAGVVLVKGGITSHVSILARSLGIPLVITDEPGIMNISDGTPILIDGRLGNVYVNPDRSVVAPFEAQRKAEALAVGEPPLADETRTRDGHRVRLLANINLLNDVATARSLNAEGVGLYRTEFPFIVRSNFPTEEEQYAIYRRLLDEMAGREVTIRTLDVGGEKVLAYADVSTGDNPELGLRSIRFSLSNRAIFEPQVRAILRAGADSPDLRMLFPMISSIDEFREARNVVQECAAALASEGVPHHGSPRIGVMVEVPSLMEILDGLAREANFFSIGTNDFVQYTLAVDRTNEKVAGYYQPHHPGILRGLKRISAAAAAAGIDVSVCGEMGREDAYIPFLIGIGITTLSVDPRHLPRTQRLITTLTHADCQSFAARLLAEDTLAGTRRILEEGLSAFSPPAGP